MLSLSACPLANTADSQKCFRYTLHTTETFLPVFAEFRLQALQATGFLVSGPASELSSVIIWRVSTGGGGDGCHSTSLRVMICVPLSSSPWRKPEDKAGTDYTVERETRQAHKGEGN